MPRRTSTSRVNNPGSKDLSCSSTQVEQHHKNLTSRISLILDDVFQIKDDAIQSWKSAAGEEDNPFRVGFSNIRGVYTAVSGRGQGEYVLPVPSITGVPLLSWWFNWREEWDSLGQDRFGFRQASLKFFYGGSHATEPEQLAFRAEWGPFTLGRVEGKAAHPHWHTHQTLKTDVRDSSVIASITQGQLMTVQGFHLPMGGWANDNEEPTKCWQFQDVESWPEVLQDWTIRTLAYFQTQLLHEEKMAN